MFTISLDIANAFNSLPWQSIRMALAQKDVPDYLRSIMDSYFSNRWLLYSTREGWVKKRGVTCGVPQGSVLGPLLWNMGYDSVLRLGLPSGCSIIGYANDTVLIVGGSTISETLAKTELSLEMVIAEIRHLGLRLSPQKTKITVFGVSEDVVDLTIPVMRASVKVNQSFKYLGLVVDNKWNFKEHFRVLLPKVEKMAAALSRLMPNVRGPSKQRRRLYAEVIHSVIMYGSPVWASVVARDRKTSGDVRRVQRRLALRVISAYRTVSHEAAGILARIIPGDILANKYRRTYERSCAAREDVGFLTGRALL